MNEKWHVLKLLRETKKYIDKEDSLKIKELSNQTVHHAAIWHDTDSIIISVIIYAISKLIERQNYIKKDERKKIFSIFANAIDSLIIAIEKNNQEEAKNRYSIILERLKTFSPQLKEQVHSVLQKAKINKASKIYEHGISFGATAQLLGITSWELASYIGTSSANDNKQIRTISERDRIKFLEIFF